MVLWKDLRDAEGILVTNQTHWKKVIAKKNSWVGQNIDEVIDWQCGSETEGQNAFFIKGETEIEHSVTRRQDHSSRNDFSIAS